MIKLFLQKNICSFTPQPKTNFLYSVATMIRRTRMTITFGLLPEHFSFITYNQNIKQLVLFDIANIEIETRYFTKLDLLTNI